MNKIPELPKQAVIKNGKAAVYFFLEVDNMFYVTKDFHAELPLWRRYKTFGWVVRYLKSK